jgi:hypothetical protein
MSIPAAAPHPKSDREIKGCGLPEPVLDPLLAHWGFRTRDLPAVPSACAMGAIKAVAKGELLQDAQTVSLPIAFAIGKHEL